jgi:hypothetical protein
MMGSKRQEIVNFIVLMIKLSVHSYIITFLRIDPSRTYKVAGWASVQQVEGEPVWDVVARWLRAKKTIDTLEVKQPQVLGISENVGLVL